MDEDQTGDPQLTQCASSSSEIREAMSISSENLLSSNSNSNSNFRLSSSTVKLRSKSEMDLKEFARPLSFPHHHFRKATNKGLKVGMPTIYRFTQVFLMIVHVRSLIFKTFQQKEKLKCQRINIKHFWIDSLFLDCFQ